MGTSALTNNRFTAALRSKEKSGDAPLLITVIILVAFGLLMLYSSSVDYSVEILGEDPGYMLRRQFLWLLIGITAAYILSRLDYHYWRRFAVFAMAGTIFALFAVLFVS